MTDNLLQEEPQDDLVQSDPTKNYLTELVGEGKKFKTPEEMARGKFESDMFIQIQNKRMDDLRKDYLRERELNMSRAKLEEIVDQISKKQLASSETPPANEVQMEKPQLSLEDVEKAFDRREINKIEKANYALVVAKLKERFGTNYASALKPHVESLRLTDDDVNALARKSPDAFFRLMGLDLTQQQDGYQAPPKSSLRSDSFAPKVEKRTWAYYQNLRKTDPTLYYNPKTNDQMIKDAKALGKEFEDGDYNTI